MEYLYRQAGRQFIISDDSTPNDEITDEVDEVDEGFDDESITLLSSSISEHLLTVGVGTTEEKEEEKEEEEEEEEKDKDEKDELRPIHI